MDMRFVVYDCRDHRAARYRDVTLRVFAGEGHGEMGGEMELQALCTGSDPVGFARRLAEACGAPIEVIGPPAEVSRPESPTVTVAACPVQEPARPAAVFCPPKKQGQRSLFE